MTIEQEKTIELLIKDSKDNNCILGLILCGSLAKNNGNKNSDVDIFVVVNDDEFQKRKQNKDYFCGSLFNQNNYPVYVDGKIIDKNYLRKIWTNGNECIKNTFMEIKLLYSSDEEIDLLLKNIDKKNYSKDENIKKFYSLMKSYKLKADDDIKNLMQVKHSIFYSVFFACRLVLTHNNIYYPCIKNMEKELINCKNIPEKFIEKMENLLETFSLDDLNTFYDLTEKYFKAYRFDDNIRRGYVIENENYWYFNERPYSEI